MGDTRADKKNIFQAENVVVHKTRPQTGDVPSIGHVHEERDVPINSLLKAGAYLIVFVTLVGLGCWGLFEFFAARATRADPQLSPLVEKHVTPGPLLQSNPSLAMQAFRHREDSLLKVAADSSGATGRRISVDDAIERIAQDGLPAFPAPAQTVATKDSARSTAGAAAKGARP